MAYAPSTTLARLNPSWQPATQPLGDLGRFFNGRRGGTSAPAISRPAPVRPAPEMAVA